MGRPGAFTGGDHEAWDAADPQDDSDLLDAEVDPRDEVDWYDWRD